AHIPPGREGLFGLVKNVPGTLRYENQLILANGDFVMLHGRYSGLGPGIPNWIVVDIVRIENGVLAEHWDVIQDEATRKSSKSGLPMFGDKLSERALNSTSVEGAALKAIQIEAFSNPAEVVKAVDIPDVGAPVAALK